MKHQGILAKGYDMGFSAYIGIGSNIRPEENLPKTAGLLQRKWPDIRFSSIYSSSAREVLEQDDFLNAVARFTTDLKPRAILKELQAIEAILHKAPPYRFGPRTVDLDILILDDLVLPTVKTWTRDQKAPIDKQHASLYVPHLRMHRRKFVLAPLSEHIDPNLKHPVIHQSWKSLAGAAAEQICKKTRLAWG